MTDDLYLPVKIAGLTFKNPYYVSSGPTARTVRQLKAIEKAGWAAASLKLSIDPKPYINHNPRYAILKQYNALAFTAEKRLTFDEGMRLMSDAKREVREILLMANMAYAGDGGPAGWARMAMGFEGVGADAIELNLCCPNMSFNIEATTGGIGVNPQCSGVNTGNDAGADQQRSGASIGRDAGIVADITAAVKKAVKIPVFVKLTPEGGDIGNVAKAAFLAGADAVSGTGNRLGMPPINLEDPGAAAYHLQKEISLGCFCGGWLKPLAQRDTYEIRKACGPSVPILATGGIRTAWDALEMAMCGADMVGVCTETLLSGYNYINSVVHETKQWLNSHGYKSFSDIRDMVAATVKAAPELTLYQGYAACRRADCPLSADCGLCAEICPESAIVIDGSGEVVIDRESCSACGICMYQCPNTNIEIARGRFSLSKGDGYCRKQYPSL